jgi:hypothetical protein
VRYLHHLSGNITFVSTRLNLASEEKLKPYANILVRQNKGYDFYSYKMGFNSIQNIGDVDHLIFFNSSFVTFDPKKLYKKYLSGIYGDSGGGSKGVAAVKKYIKETGAADTVVATDETGTKQSFTVSKSEAAKLRAGWAARDARVAKLAITSTSISALKGAIGAADTKSGIRFGTNIATDEVYKALGITKEQFDKTYRFGGDPNKVIADSKIEDLKTALQQALIGAQSQYNSLLAPPVDPNAPKPTYVPRGAMVPDLPAYVPSAPGASAGAGAPAGPKGTTGDPLTVSDPEVRVLGSAISKLANATPNVLVVNVKNKSELDALYRKLGLPVT